MYIHTIKKQNIQLKMLNILNVLSKQLKITLTAALC